MATLVLTAAGAALGGTLGSGGAIIGQAIGSMVGSHIDRALFGEESVLPTRQGPRAFSLDVQSSIEGSSIPRIYGRHRLAGQMIWATRLEEVVNTQTVQTGGKGGGGGGSSQTQTSYAYYANFALALCEGEITGISAAWADGHGINLSNYTYRLYRGTQTQNADALIVAKEGAGKAPAYRGTAYIVFERMPLAEFSNRIPQLQFEITRPVAGVENHIRAVSIIPGATEFGYDDREMVRIVSPGVSHGENKHSTNDATDWQVSTDELVTLCPNLKSVSLVVAWFGNDLRAARCLIEPRTESKKKSIQSHQWRVAGLTRLTAKQVSSHQGGVAYGGSPNDASVIRAIQSLKSRGVDVTIHPFIMMDIAAGNSLPNPYDGSQSQPAYPWRGQISIDPAVNQAKSADKTVEAHHQVTAFLGQSIASQFAIDGSTVNYNGTPDWRFRHFILHMAHLAKAAGGVHGFLVGSELVQLCRARSAISGDFPFVNGLVQLLADVKGILPAAKVSYAADWSEYFGYHPADGSGDVYFHLDKVWASSHADMVAIDNYMPLSDWRDGAQHKDAAQASWFGDFAYLQSQIEGGEGYDYHYASQDDRNTQTRAPISDGLAQTPWVFRYKDIRNWWENAHYNRIGGAVAPSATPWSPGSKPVWFSEIGFPAIDKSTNQPNAFVDAKSSASAIPYFSSGQRNDAAQRAAMKAVLAWWNPTHPDYGGKNAGKAALPNMVDPDHIYWWAWDARPFPAFPSRLDVWSDGVNWARGHWLNGRLGQVSVADLIAAILVEHGCPSVDTNAVSGTIDGYVLDRPLSARQAIEPLLDFYLIDATEREGKLIFRQRPRPVDAAILEDRLVMEPNRPSMQVVRTQETELPNRLSLRFVDAGNHFRPGAIYAQRQSGFSARHETLNLAAAASSNVLKPQAEQWLHEQWLGRDSYEFGLAYAHLALEVGDVVRVGSLYGETDCVITRIDDGLFRRVRARRTATSAKLAHEVETVRKAEPVIAPGVPVIAMMDLPILEAGSGPHGLRVAAYANPWTGPHGVFRGSSTTGFQRIQILELPATMGQLRGAAQSAVHGRWDYGHPLIVQLHSGGISGLNAQTVLNGANIAAIRADNSAWELIQFQTATLIGTQTYRLDAVLRGQWGTEAAALAGSSDGADFVILNEATPLVHVPEEIIGQAQTYRIGPLNRPIDDITYVTAADVQAFKSQLPYAPVWLRGAWHPNGDIALSWVRRARFGGDSWERSEILLAESAERYRCEILGPGNGVKRKETLTIPSFTYGQPLQISDFGSLQSNLSVRITQISPEYDAGQGTTMNLSKS